MTKSSDDRARWIRPLLCTGMVACLLAVAGCAHQKPQLYPNPASQERPRAMIDNDIAECEQLAEAHGVDYKKGQVARRTVEGGVVGGASGAAVGAIFGDVGRGAAVGAAHGATHGFFRGLFAGNQPHPAYRRFVEQCLQDKGYRPIGWQ